MFFLFLVQKCFISGGYFEKCLILRMLYLQCCYVNGEGSCCFYDGNCCYINMIINVIRDYCLRLQDDQLMKICCVIDGEVLCCIFGGNCCCGDVIFRDYCLGFDEDF